MSGNRLFSNSQTRTTPPLSAPSVSPTPAPQSVSQSSQFRLIVRLFVRSFDRSFVRSSFVAPRTNERTNDEPTNRRTDEPTNRPQSQHHRMNTATQQRPWSVCWVGGQFRWLVKSSGSPSLGGRYSSRVVRSFVAWSVSWLVRFFCQWLVGQFAFGLH